MLQYIHTSGYDVSTERRPTGVVECSATPVGGGMRLVARCDDGAPGNRTHRAIRRLLHLVAADARQRLAA